MLDDQPVRYIDTITERYARLGYAPYRWYEAEDEPAWTPLAAPLGRVHRERPGRSACERRGDAGHLDDVVGAAPA